VSLEDRLDDRLDGAPGDGSLSLSKRWKQNQREQEAAVFESIADQIEQGLLKIKGEAKPDDVAARLRKRAEGTRNGTDRMRRRSRKPDG